jgi:hypothetical protein
MLRASIAPCGPYDEEWLPRRGVRLAALLAGVITFGGETHDKVGRGTRTRVRTAVIDLAMAEGHSLQEAKAMARDVVARAVRQSFKVVSTDD